MNIREVYGLTKAVGDFGIEIEVEGRNLPREVNAYWRAEEDNSLRGESREYIFAKPQNLEKLRPMLATLDKAFKTAGSILQFSFRTSVHVHMNVQEIEPEALLALVYTYLLLEDPLMNLCGESRKGNRFCLRMQDAEGLVDNLKQIFERHEDGFARINRDRIRYAAINTEAVTKYGSLEFRAMEGNFDIPRIVNWCTLLKCLRTFAIEHKTPMGVYDLYNALGPVEFAKKVFGENYPLIEYKDLMKDVQRGYSLSLDLPFSYKKAISTAIYKKPAVAKMEQWPPGMIDMPVDRAAFERELGRQRAAAIDHLEAAIRRPAMVVMDDLVDAAAAQAVAPQEW